MLDIDRDAGQGCPFLETADCGVYKDRPEACRLFPITRGSSLEKRGIKDTYFCKRLDFCRGFSQGREWTLAQWKADQGLEPYDKLNREWLEIILKRGAFDSPAADTRGPATFYLVAYDPDKFRRFVLETPFLKIFEIPPEVAEVLQKSDAELVRFGYAYVKMVLLLEDPLRMKEEMQTMRQPADLPTS
jgi:hypothetical protein